MRSMTGFGRAELERAGVRVAADVRALNQRFFELKLNLPRGWGEHEAALRKLVQTFVERGRVEVAIRRINLGPPSTRLRVDEPLARQYVEELRRLGKRLGLEGRVTLEAMLQRPELLQVVEEEEDYAADLELGRRALRRALRALDLERSREGRGLKRDLAARLGKIELAMGKVRKLAAASREAIIEAFRARMRELLGNLPLDEKRLYEEAAGAALRADISEELVRMATHLEGFRGLLARRRSVGREIEFLLQELNREVNTIGAKSQNAELSRIVVEVKGELEKIREQVQNVE